MTGDAMCQELNKMTTDCLIYGVSTATSRIKLFRQGLLHLTVNIVHRSVLEHVIDGREDVAFIAGEHGQLRLQVPCATMTGLQQSRQKADVTEKT
jgi:hypothetical protein